MIPEYPEVHQQGSLGICNQDEVLAELDYADNAPRYHKDDGLWTVSPEELR